jgi:hypothetical protein
MQVEMHCRRCRSRLIPTVSPQTELIWKQINEEGPWSMLGDGQTVEDRLSAQLQPGSATCCPQCGAAIGLTEETLGQLALELLSQW